MPRTTTLWKRPGRNRLAAVVLLPLLLSAHAGRLAAADRSGNVTPAEAVRGLESARAQALLQADTTALSRMVADEFVEISRFGQLRTKVDNIREIGSGELKLTSVKYDSLTVRI
jgi:hypothetical protein